jgi:hypothetical protein
MDDAVSATGERKQRFTRYLLGLVLDRHTSSLSRRAQVSKNILVSIVHPDYHQILCVSSKIRVPVLPGQASTVATVCQRRLDRMEILRSISQLAVEN